MLWEEAAFPACHSEHTHPLVSSHLSQRNHFTRGFVESSICDGIPDLGSEHEKQEGDGFFFWKQKSKKQEFTRFKGHPTEHLEVYDTILF